MAPRQMKDDVDAPPSAEDVAEVDFRASLQQKLPKLQPDETMAAYSARVGRALDLEQCRVVHAIEGDGLYLYKRPVRGSAGAMLRHAGSVFHHIVLYLKSAGQGLVALEMGPQGAADVADNIFEAVETGPVLMHAAEPPGDDAPLLHIVAPHHPLSDPAIQKAIEFAQAQQYHTVHSNCIQFADFVVRLLTGGAVFGVSLAYDVMCGTVPTVDSPLLGFLSMMQLSWLHLCDGSRLMAQFLASHAIPAALTPPKLLSAPSAQADASVRAGSRPQLPPRGAAAEASADSLPHFLSAALSAARGSGAAQPQAPTGDSAFSSGSTGDRNGGGNLSDLLGSVLAAARSSQQAAGAASSQGGVSGAASGGMPGLLSSALAGGLQEVITSTGAGAKSGPLPLAVNDQQGAGGGGSGGSTTMAEALSAMLAAARSRHITQAGAGSLANGNAGKRKSGPGQVQNAAMGSDGALVNGGTNNTLTGDSAKPALPLRKPKGM